MLKNLFLILFVLKLLGSADTLSEAFSNATVDGEVRILHYSRDADSSPIFSKASATAIGTQLGLSTKAIHNIKLNLRYYSTNVLSGSGSELAASNVVDGEDGYALLGEANIEYNDGVNILKVGRQALYTPLIMSDDARVVKDLFEAAVFSTSFVKDTKLTTMYITKNSGMDNDFTGLGLGKSNFVSMSKSLGTSYDEAIALVGIENTSLKNLSLSAWYYDAIKVVNMYYVDSAYTFDIAKESSLKLQAHYWAIKSKNEYEEDTSKKVDYNYGGVRASLTQGDATFQLAQEQINYADDSVGIHTVWGMYTEYTYGILMGSGIYGAINGYNGEYVTKVDATKFTFLYDFGNDVSTYIGYDIFNGNNDAMQSDMNLLDLYISFPCQMLENATWALLYENWDSDGDKIMVDNNLFKLKYTYTF